MVIGLKAINNDVDGGVEGEIEAVLEAILEATFNIWAAFNVEDGATSS